eukprot:3523575-Pyramimonas_sp.AAC.2
MGPVYEFVLQQEARLVQYFGRPSSAACATASPDIHAKETLELCVAALGVAEDNQGHSDDEGQ